MTAIARLHSAYAARHTYRPPGAGPLVGCITQAVPLELLLAAGVRPVRLFGDPARVPTLGAKYLEDEAEGEVRSIFDRLLASDYGDLDLILLPRVSEVHLQLHYYIAEVRKWEPQAKIPPVEIVDVMQTAFWSTGRYVRARLDDLAARLGGVGRPVTEAALSEAIQQANAMRRALQALNALRRKGRFKGSDMLRITALFGALPGTEFLDLAEALAAEAGPPAQGPRLMISGSLQDDPGLFELAESLGAQVVADDHTGGERVFAHLVDQTMIPMEAITDHYHLHAPGLRQFPQKPQDDRFVATVQAAGAQADLCMLEAGDDTLGWDFPVRRKRLAGLGIPSTLLTRQDYFAPDRAAQRACLETVLSGLKEGVE